MILMNYSVYLINYQLLNQIYYIYDLRGAVFGIDDIGDYIIVVEDGLIIKDELDDSEIVKVSIYSSSE